MRVQHIPVGEEYYLDKETYVRTPGNQPRLNVKDTSTPRHPITVLENGIDLLVRLHKLLTNVGNWNRGGGPGRSFFWDGGSRGCPGVSERFQTIMRQWVGNAHGDRGLGAHRRRERVASILAARQISEIEITYPYG